MKGGKNEMAKVVKMIGSAKHLDMWFSETDQSSPIAKAIRRLRLEGCVGGGLMEGRMEGKQP